MPNGFRLFDSALASFFTNCALDLGPEELVSGDYGARLGKNTLSRAKVFTDTAASKIWVTAAPLQFPGEGHITAVGGHFQWVPIQCDVTRWQGLICSREELQAGYRGSPRTGSDKLVKVGSPSAYGCARNVVPQTPQSAERRSLVLLIDVQRENQLKGDVPLSTITMTDKR